MSDELPIGEQVSEAITQLKRSERGRAAAVAFRALIANGGGGLDTMNWEALETLCKACRLCGGSAAYTIKDALPSR